jgi:hypothetical protein
MFIGATDLGKVDHHILKAFYPVEKLVLMADHISTSGGNGESQ